MADWSRRTPAGAVGRSLSKGDNVNMDTFATNPGTAHTKSGWTQQIASCPFDADGLIVIIFNSTGSPQDWLFDIGVGGSGSEQVLIPDVYLRSQANDAMGEKAFFPVAIPAGTRIATRAQGSSTGGVIQGQLVPVKSGLLGAGGFQKCISAGVVSASSRGLQMTMDYTVGWTLLRDTCPEMKGIVVSGWRSNADATNADVCLLDLGIGAGGAGAASSILLPGLPIRFPLNGQGNGCLSGWWPLRVPEGCSLWARSNGFGYASHFVNVAVYGFQ